MSQIIDRVAAIIDPDAFDDARHAEGKCEDCDDKRKAARKKSHMIIVGLGLEKQIVLEQERSRLASPYIETKEN